MKGYLLRGAQEPRLNPNTGQLEPPDPVQGAPETVYQLDAYGALTLLSKERAGTPICGYPVSVRNDSLLLEKPSGTVGLPVMGADVLFSVSVAQGGRRVSVFNFDGTTGKVYSILTDHEAGVLGTTDDGIRRVYLETDTVDVDHGEFFDRLLPTFLIRRAGAPTPQLFDPYPSLVEAPAFGGEAFLGEISPDAEWAALVLWQIPVEGGIQKHQTYLVPTGGGSAALLDERLTSTSQICGLTICDSGTNGLAWSHDARRATFVRPRWFGLPQFDPVETIVKTGQPGVALDSVSIPDLLLNAPRFTADDSVMIVSQQDMTLQCERELRQAHAPEVLLSATPEECSFSTQIIPNAPPPNPAPIATSSTWLGTSATGFRRASYKGDTERTRNRLRLLPRSVKAN